LPLSSGEDQAGESDASTPRCIKPNTLVVMAQVALDYENQSRDLPIKDSNPC
jgi:hypothetical protein